MSMYDEFLSITLGSLSDFLSLRGLSTTGRKVELVARAFSAWEQNVPLKINQTQQSASLANEYLKRLADNNLQDPWVIPDCDFVNDVSKWPGVDLGNIFSYILRVKAVDSEYIGKHKDEKAFSYWKSNFVDTILVSKIDEKRLVLKCKVTPSQRIRDESRELWICLDNGGNIICGWCSCTAGTSECCNHIIATLYKMEYDYSQGYTNPSCTSVPCSWNQQTKKDVEPCRIVNLVVRKDKRTADRQDGEGIISDAWKEFDPRKPFHRKITETDKQKFLDGYKTINSSAVLFKSAESSTSCSTESSSIPLNLVDAGREFILTNPNLSEQGKISKFLETCQINDTQKEKIKKETRGQSDNRNWREQRKGRVTASKFREIHTKVDSILKCRGSKKPKTTPLVTELIYRDTNLSAIPAIKWGMNNENSAPTAFHSSVLSTHLHPKLQRCGLFVLKEKSYIAASPDSVLSCVCHGTFVVEIKCPFSIHDKTIAEGWQNTDFLSMNDGQIHLKKEHKYYFQIIGQMAVKPCELGYFVVYTTKDLFVEEIRFDKAYWELILNNLDIFFKSYVLRVLLGFTDIYLCPQCEQVVLEEPEITAPEQNSVCCDRCSSWYHYQCVGISCAPKDQEWLCSSCLLLMCDG